MIKTTLLAILLVAAVSAQRGGGRGGRGKPKCSDGSQPSCSDGSQPDGDKPQTCADGSSPTGGRGGGRGRCPKEERICCDGSTPTHDGDRSTPPCDDGRKPKCSQDDC